MFHADRDLILEKLGEISIELRELRTEVARLQAVPSAQNDYLTIAEAAKEFKLSAGNLYRKKFLHRRFGRSVRILRSDLENLLRRPARL